MARTFHQEILMTYNCVLWAATPFCLSRLFHLFAFFPSVPILLLHLAILHPFCSYLLLPISLPTYLLLHLSCFRAYCASAPILLLHSWYISILTSNYGQFISRNILRMIFSQTIRRRIDSILWPRGLRYSRSKQVSLRCNAAVRKFSIAIIKQDIVQRF